MEERFEESLLDLIREKFRPKPEPLRLKTWMDVELAKDEIAADEQRTGKAKVPCVKYGPAARPSREQADSFRDRYRSAPNRRSGSSASACRDRAAATGAEIHPLCVQLRQAVQEPSGRWRARRRVSPVQETVGDPGRADPIGRTGRGLRFEDVGEEFIHQSCGQIDGRVVAGGGAQFDDIEADNTAALCDLAEEGQCFIPAQAAGFGRARGGHDRSVEEASKSTVR